MIKLSKKIVIISTPYRYHPLEFHTKITFIHWLPKNIHRMILKKFNLVFYSKEENLNLLSKSDLSSFIKNEKIKSKYKYTETIMVYNSCVWLRVSPSDLNKGL